MKAGNSILLIIIPLFVSCYSQNLTIKVASPPINLSVIGDIASSYTECQTSTFYDKTDFLKEYISISHWNKYGYPGGNLEIDIIDYPNMKQFNNKENIISSKLPFNTDIESDLLDQHISSCTNILTLSIIYCSAGFDIHCIILYNGDNNNSTFGQRLDVFISDSNSYTTNSPSGINVKCLNDGNFIIFYVVNDERSPVYRYIFYSVLDKNGSFLLENQIVKDIKWSENGDLINKVLFDNGYSNKFLFITYYDDSTARHSGIFSYIVSYNNITYGWDGSPNELKISSQNIYYIALGTEVVGQTNQYIDFGNGCCFIFDYIYFPQTTQYIIITIIDNKGNIVATNNDRNNNFDPLITFGFGYNINVLSTKLIGDTTDRYFIINTVDKIAYYAYLMQIKYTGGIDGTYKLNLVNKIMLQQNTITGKAPLWGDSICSQILNDSLLFIGSFRNSVSNQSIVGQTWSMTNTN